MSFLRPSHANCVCVTLTAMQLFFQRVQIFFQSNLHPYESSTGHNARSQYDEQKQGVAHIAALRVASPVEKRNVVMLDFTTAQPL